MILEDMVEYGAIVDEKRASLEAALNEPEFNAREYMTGLCRIDREIYTLATGFRGFDSLASSDRR